MYVICVVVWEREKNVRAQANFFCETNKQTYEQEKQERDQSCQARFKVSFEGKHERSKKLGDNVQHT